MILLKHHCKDYDRRVCQALIPFLMERLNNIKDEISSKSRSDKMRKDVPFLKKMQENLKNELETEKKELKEMAQEIYDIWLKICKIRTDANAASTQFDLKVHQGDNQDDVLFNLVKRNNPGSLTKEVENRRSKVERTQAFCKLIIDGLCVAETKKVPISWPSYEIDILDQF